MRVKGVKNRQLKYSNINYDVKYQAIMKKNLRVYSRQNVAWLRIIDKIIFKPKILLMQIHYEQQGEWMQKYFRSNQGIKQIYELVQYYKYYKSTPLLVNQYHFLFMNCYWTKSKTIYYLKIKKILKIQQEEREQTLQRNISQSQSKISENKSTFYIMPQLYITPLDTNRTLEKILTSLHKQNIQTKPRTIIDIDKTFKLTHKDQSKTKDRNSQQKSHIKSNPSNFVSHFTCKNPTVKRKKNNHKSLSNEPNYSQQRISKGKKLTTVNSCLNIAFHDINLNYERRQKMVKNPQKQIKSKKRQISQINTNETKKNHKKVQSYQKSSEIAHKSKSGKKRVDTQNNVRAAIDKTKNKIKMQKNQMLKKYIQSRQSYAKSIDSTCGDVVKHPRK